MSWHVAHVAHVFDLDGVVRDFTPGSVDATIEQALALTAGTVSAMAFRPDLVEPAITGRVSFEQWCAGICAGLERVVTEPGRVRGQLQAWVDYRGEPIPETVERLTSLRAAGRRTYVFTNGTDHVPAELELLGLGSLFDGVLNSADFGVAKPDPAAYAAAHQAIEADLARPVPRGAVWFTDDRAANVVAARDFGWHAELFERTSPT